MMRNPAAEFTPDVQGAIVALMEEVKQSHHATGRR